MEFTAPAIDLRGQVAVVTGGSRGLGRSIALALAQAGADVVLSSRSQESADEAAAAIAAATGRRVRGVEADVRSPQAACRLADVAVRELGGLDIAVHNAGVAITRFALDVTEDDWDLVVDTHLKGAFFAAQAACQRMKDEGGGVIINISSVLGSVGEKAVVPYCAAKGGMENLTRALALEWARFGVRVVSVAPAYVKTEMNEEWIGAPHVLERILRKTPLGRLGTPRDVCAAVAFLASDLACYITGSTLYVDGGWVAQ